MIRATRKLSSTTRIRLPRSLRYPGIRVSLAGAGVNIPASGGRVRLRTGFRPRDERSAPGMRGRRTENKRAPARQAPRPGGAAQAAYNGSRRCGLQDDLPSAARIAAGNAELCQGCSGLLGDVVELAAGQAGAGGELADNDDVTSGGGCGAA